MDDVTPYLGKIVLIGVTYFGPDGKKVRGEVGHGRIVRMDEHGIVVRIEPHHKEFRLPPDTSQLHKAAPGEYRESTTGITIIDPDFITSWEIHEVAAEAGGGTNWKPRPKTQFPER
jgi:hypothetical protein